MNCSVLSLARNSRHYVPIEARERAVTILVRDSEIVRALSMRTIRTHYLDTSAIVKLLVDEDGSAVVRAYLGSHATLATTSVCLAETLGVLKLKFRRKLLSEEQYLAASEELLAHVRNETLEIDDIGISERSTFDEMESLIKRYSLDVADAYQLVTLTRGLYSRLEGDSRPILVTADEALAKAAKSEGLRAWDLLRESAP